MLVSAAVFSGKLRVAVPPSAKTGALFALSRVRTDRALFSTPGYAPPRNR